MTVLIVARTRMSGDRRCIGGLTDEGRSVRLLTRSGLNWNATSDLYIGQIRNIDFTPDADVKPPHVEDVRCRTPHPGQFLRWQPNLRDRLLGCVTPWEGSIKQVFGGLLRYTNNGSAYVSHRVGVPDQSTGYWIPNAPLTLSADRKYYAYRRGTTDGRLKYVGEHEPRPIVRAGTLVRVSLARWWAPDDAGPELEERCYLQLSGWYDHEA